MLETFSRIISNMFSNVESNTHTRILSLQDEKFLQHYISWKHKNWLHNLIWNWLWLLRESKSFDFKKIREKLTGNKIKLEAGINESVHVHFWGAVYLHTRPMIQTQIRLLTRIITFWDIELGHGQNQDFGLENGYVQKSTWTRTNLRRTFPADLPVRWSLIKGWAVEFLIRHYPF